MVSQRYTFISQLVVSLLFISVLLHHNIDSKFGITNDHDIISALGTDLQTSFREVPGLVMKTETGRPGKSLRYRPAFWTIFYTEAAVWGNNPSIWYISRIILFGITLAIGWHLLGKKLGVLGGGLACIVLLSHSCWIELFSNLLCSETYAAPALAVYCLAFFKLWSTDEQERARWWLLLALAAGAAMGSKENLTPLILSTALLTSRAFAKRCLGIAGAISSTLIISFGLFIVGAVLIGLSCSGVDCYNNSVTLAAKLRVLANCFSNFQYLLWPFMVTLCFVITEKLLVYRKLLDKASLDIKMVWYQALFLSVWLSQYIFYDGQWPSNNRYDFPGVLFTDLVWIMMVYCIVKFLTEQCLRLTEARKQVVTVACYLILSLVFMYFNGWHEIKNLYSTSQSYSIATNRFQDVLARTIKIAKQDETVPIVIATHTIMDYEGIFSVMKYMRAFGVRNKVGIRIADDNAYATPKSPLEKALASHIKTISEKGKVGWVGWVDVSPLGEINKQCPCTILNINLYEISLDN